MSKLKKNIIVALSIYSVFNDMNFIHSAFLNNSLNINYSNYLYLKFDKNIEKS